LLLLFFAFGQIASASLPKNKEESLCRSGTNSIRKGTGTTPKTKLPEEN